MVPASAGQQAYTNVSAMLVLVQTTLLKTYINDAMYIPLLTITAGFGWKRDTFTRD